MKKFFEDLIGPNPDPIDIENDVSSECQVENPFEFSDYDSD